MDFAHLGAEQLLGRANGLFVASAVTLRRVGQGLDLRLELADLREEPVKPLVLSCRPARFLRWSCARPRLRCMY